MSTTGRDIMRTVSRAADDALKQAAQELLERAKRDVPVGDPAEDPDPTVSIIESGYVRKLAPGVYEVGFDAPHAAKQHEDQRLKHPRGGKARFLEDNLKVMLPRLNGIVAGEVHKRTVR